VVARERAGGHGRLGGKASCRRQVTYTHDTPIFVDLLVFFSVATDKLIMNACVSGGKWVDYTSTIFTISSKKTYKKEIMNHYH
jgi:hypothetical protein